MLDIFSSNPAFSVTSLTLALNRFPFIPGRIGDLGLFVPRRLTTVSTTVEVKSGRLALVPSMPRGAPPIQNVDDRRQLVPFLVPHFPLSDTLMADEVQGVRAFGTEDMLEPLQQRMDEKLESMGRKQDVTLEYLRLGAVKGLVVTRVNPLNGAPEVAIDMRQAFGMPAKPLVTPGPGAVPIPYDVDWPIIFTPTGTAADLQLLQLIALNGELTQLILTLTRLMANRLGAAGFTSIHGICGSDFFDAFYKHPEIRSTYVNYPAAATLRDPLWMRQIAFREIILEEYRGHIGGIPFVEPDMCHFFPVGVPELFVEAYSPADYIETVNTIALPRYAKQEVIPFGKGIMIETQQNVLPICSLPDCLLTARVVDRP
jgi:major capsid protein E